MEEDFFAGAFFGLEEVFLAGAALAGAALAGAALAGAALLELDVFLAGAAFFALGAGAASSALVVGFRSRFGRSLLAALLLENNDATISNTCTTIPSASTPTVTPAMSASGESIFVSAFLAAALAANFAAFMRSNCARAFREFRAVSFASRVVHAAHDDARALSPPPSSVVRVHAAPIDATRPKTIERGATSRWPFQNAPSPSIAPTTPPFPPAASRAVPKRPPRGFHPTPRDAPARAVPDATPDAVARARIRIGIKKNKKYTSIRRRRRARASRSTHRAREGVASNEVADRGGGKGARNHIAHSRALFPSPRARRTKDGASIERVDGCVDARGYVVLLYRAITPRGGVRRSRSRATAGGRARGAV